MNREYHAWWSHRLNRTMELLIFGHAGAKVLVFPTRGGRFFEYEKLRMVDSIREKIERGWLQIYCLDSIDPESFYCWWAHPAGRIQRHIQYEEYVLCEVLPFMQEKNCHPCVIAHGCSLGAFHAANFAFRHPQLFRKLVAFSGRYDLSQEFDGFANLFSGYYDENIYFHTPTHYLPGLNCPLRLHHLRQMEVVLVIGEEDPFRGNNEYLSSILSNKGISHQLHLWQERAHRGSYWRKMVQLYL